VFYADGSTFTSEQGSWAEAPPFGVQAVVYYHVPAGTTLQMDSDVYCWLGQEAGGQPWKMGLFVDDDAYWRVHDLVSKAVTP
jgi:hypothetical protein